MGELREAGVLLAQEATIPVAARKLGITEQTLCRWLTGYGGMKLDQGKRLRKSLSPVAASVTRGAALRLFRRQSRNRPGQLQPPRQ